ncbi:MAG: ACT domain-containing protein [Spirochaetaceae bacterium]|jgi:hypothetical protein|nr:ACT domain-containing protein [Spirochaetaceae bacterium]
MADLFKLEIFIPRSHFENLREVLRSSGAGHLGNYDRCLSWSTVSGCWRPLNGSSPYNGTEGVLCEAEEYKVEVCCLGENLRNTVSAIRSVHPYEEPVINIIALTSLEKPPELTLELLPMLFSVCKLAEKGEADLSGLDLSESYTFLSRTEDECSLVCPAEKAPAGCIARSDGWNCLKVRGPLDFSLTGVLAGITSVLAGARIPVFAVSTFNTDYILVRKENTDSAAAVLEKAGYTITGSRRGDEQEPLL